MATENKNQITWQALEFKHYEKSFGWYLALYCIAFLLIVYEIFERDIFAAVTVFILTVFVSIFSKQEPKLVSFTLGSQGIRIDNVGVPYKQIKFFWIVNDPRHRTLNLETTAYFHNMIIMELGDQNPEPIRQLLLRYLPEHEETEPTFVQRVMHRLKF